MNRSILVVLLGLLGLLSGAALAAPKPCEELRQEIEVKIQAAGVTSYLIHGVFNNYSGIDKVAVPFWFLLAAIAVVAQRARARDS